MAKHSWVLSHTSPRLKGWPAAEECEHCKVTRTRKSESEDCPKAHGH